MGKISDCGRREKSQSGYDSRVFRPRFSALLLFLLLPAAPGRAEVPRPSAAYPFLLAGALLADGETEAALAAYAEAAELAPEDPYVRLEQASVLARSGRFVRRRRRSASPASSHRSIRRCCGPRRRLQ